MGEESFLIEGAGGIFDVNMDGKLVYSKHETGEFPDEDALVGELQGIADLEHPDQSKLF